MTTRIGRAPTRWTKRGFVAVLTVFAATMAVITGVLVFSAVPASATKDVRVTICHATSSHSNPYVEITVRGSSINEVQNELFNGHGDHVGPVYDPDVVPSMEDWGDIIPAFGEFPGINPTAVVAGCTVGVYEAFDASQAYCAVDSGTYSGYVAATLSVTGYRTQELADEALVEAAEEVTAGIIPAFGTDDATFDGLNWDTAGQALFAAGCVTTPAPTLYGGTAEYPKVMVCLGPDVIEVGPIGATHSTPVVYASVAEANAAAGAYVASAITGKTVEFMAAHPEYAPVPADGICIPPTTVAPVSVAPVEAATVAPVEAATVTTQEPETVAVPAPAKVATPAAVPAGDGSTVPQVPVALLALLALTTAIAVTSGLRLATNR